MDKLKMKSHDLTKDNIDKIAKLFPNVITEVKDAQGKTHRGIDFDLLKQELSAEIVEGEKERYQLTWPGKKEAIVLANTPTTKTLRPIKEESVNWDNTQNIYIEGDNLEVLKLLQEAYLAKIKCIYIDPPYNTGKDFIYKDDYKQVKAAYLEKSGQIDEYGNKLFQNNESNGRFHSDWLTMMYSRLKLARNLLRNEGLIFISIDDNEVHNLRKICDEVFGAENFVIEFAWRRTDNQANIGNVARVKEYIVCYCKDYQKFNFNRLPLSDKALNEYRYEDEHGKFRRDILFHKTRGRYRYNVKTPSGKIISGPWMINEDRFKELLKSEGIYWTSSNEEQPYGKIYLNESKGQIPNDFLGIEFGTNQRGSLEVEELFSRRLFDFPKPISLIQTLITISTSENDIILDFFSGSATTAHAVMNLNAEDGGNRKYIMVQLPEITDEESEAFKRGYKNICEIGKERIRRAGNKIKQETNAEIDYGFRVFRLDSSNMKDVYYTPDELLKTDLFSLMLNIKEDRTDEDLLIQVMLESNLELSSPMISKDCAGSKVHFVTINAKGNALAACFEDELSEEVIKDIACTKPDRVVFRDSCFINDSARINLEETFKIISPHTEIKVI